MTHRPVSLRSALRNSSFLVMSSIPPIALEATLKATSKSVDLSSNPIVRGFDFNGDESIDYFQLLNSFSTTGFQATHFGRACEQIDLMVKNQATIFLGFTSNLVSSGCREIIRFLCQNRLIDAIVTTAGGVEEDFIKCLAPTFVAEFSLDGEKLRENGLNRIGNLLVPNDNYCRFEDWLTPILNEIVDKNELNCIWTPSKLIERLGKEIANEQSIYYWCWKNSIPVFCPAITDGSLGDMLYFHSYRKPGLKIDILEDLKRINSIAVQAKTTGMLILGGGIVKHHICNANLMRNGADYAVYVNTGAEYDGSDSGASPDEAVSWGKIRSAAKPVKVHGDATLIFPLIVAQTFARHMYSIRPQNSTEFQFDLPTNMYKVRPIISDETESEEISRAQDKLLAKIDELFRQLELIEEKRNPRREEFVVNLSVKKPAEKFLKFLQENRDEFAVRIYRHSSASSANLPSLNLSSNEQNGRSLVLIWADGENLPSMRHGTEKIFDEEKIVELISNELKK